MTTNQTPGPAAAAIKPSADPGIDTENHYETGEPHQYSSPAQPRLGEVIREAERLGVQLLAVLGRDVDPTSEPTALVWPELGVQIPEHRVLLTSARLFVQNALLQLAKIADLPLPPVGSAVQLPARQDPAATGPGIATTGGPVDTPRHELGVLGPECASLAGDTS